MGRGGATKRERGACDVLPLRKGGGGRKGFSHVEGGHKKILKRGFHSSKGGREKCYPVLKGGGGPQKLSNPRFSHFVAPLHVSNDQSLRDSVFL